MARARKNGAGGRHPRSGRLYPDGRAGTGTGWAARPGSDVGSQSAIRRIRLWKQAEVRFQADSKTLIEENLRLEQALETEERELTDQRATLDAEAFQALAADFDEKTEAIRAAQDMKSRALTAKRDEDRQRFLQAAVPVLGELMRDSGAVAIFDKEMVILSLRGVDITDEAIARIDAALGDGSTLPLEPEIETVPQPAPGPAQQGADDGAAGGTIAP